MTRRTSTTQESRFSLVFFEIDDTYSIVETRRLEASVSGAEIIRGAKVRVKSDKEFFEAEIIEQSSSKTDLDAYLVDIEAASNNSITDQPQPTEELPKASHQLMKMPGGKTIPKTRHAKERGTGTQKKIKPRKIKRKG